MKKTPRITQKKQLSKKEFVSLAEKVRKSFEEEEEYLKRHDPLRYEYLKSRGRTITR
jgi:hypothetical protein